jgi:hypothetical protein
VLYNLHVSVIIGAIGLVLLNDFIGLFWILGLKQQLSERFLKVEHRLISAAFLGAVGTGVAMAISKPEAIRHNGFWIKMTFVAMIGLNGLFMGKKCGALAQQRFRSLSARTKASISISVLISLFLWFATALIGLTVMHADF